MSIEQWLALGLSSSILLCLPGPANLAVMSYALGYGKAGAIAAVLGTTFGTTAVMLAALTGLVALLSLSPESYSVLEWIGTLYIAIFLIRLVRAPLPRTPLADNDNMRARKLGLIFLDRLVSTALSPKTILLFVSVFAQFVDVLRLEIAHVVTFSSLFAALSLSITSVYAIFAQQIFDGIRATGMRRILKKAPGKTRIGGGKVAFGYRRMAA
ncbi:LysE family translocator [Rhizobiaceae bacterium n13]|uniref:LysE family translocator n=1 Tax=Ferirhizobium litorale TaxID=2927786 RepID=A0AAE3U2H6_9HYPH|nr:LysE family translocator [Fererhizobium litorale]MDI7863771.1 LysE family translocator [Fererhizobium litorale]MDI7924129.1 LysE family translocator [Fererhizobium litorale]